jgi:hypothetical protein
LVTRVEELGEHGGDRLPCRPLRDDRMDEARHLWRVVGEAS